MTRDCSTVVVRSDRDTGKGFDRGNVGRTSVSPHSYDSRVKTGLEGLWRIGWYFTSLLFGQVMIRNLLEFLTGILPGSEGNERGRLSA